MILYVTKLTLRRTALSWSRGNWFKRSQVLFIFPRDLPEKVRSCVEPAVKLSLGEPGACQMRLTLRETVIKLPEVNSFFWLTVKHNETPLMQPVFEFQFVARLLLFNKKLPEFTLQTENTLRRETRLKTKNSPNQYESGEGTVCHFQFISGPQSVEKLITDPTKLVHPHPWSLNNLLIPILACDPSSQAFSPKFFPRKGRADDLGHDEKTLWQNDKMGERGQDSI